MYFSYICLNTVNCAVSKHFASTVKQTFTAFHYERLVNPFQKLNYPWFNISKAINHNLMKTCTLEAIARVCQSAYIIIIMILNPANSWD